MHPKASREAQIQNFKTMIVAVRTAYITVINFWPLHFYRYTLIKQIKVQLSLSNVCNKVQCISTNARASQPDTASSVYFRVFCGTFLRNHAVLISKKCCSKHLRKTFIFILFLSTFCISAHLKIYFFHKLFSRIFRRIFRVIMAKPA